mmetsp:Transcript_19743/g.42519  ORF Transcript_19743/g.42519 Transcript_19743/m.42519 type:complete len:281 (-) Transcript_19743:368-1210(-)|eukprot:CAMPEP_0183358174 /NCGR_PEP_ID=MMETSP0164_2-20130417/48422_1 /TAXON_ID=221442 /ORGANISM="Coccolithus pelagicus ssp braarudi, Strain PLY182g" /LENGTH=280 /DNA_ID=CAMNT_0025532011 /DNA_START=28 /DNA_END=870 /DNA_ORIENTATION=-
MAPHVALYQLLGIAPDASASEIKRAYLKAARLTHPDKCSDEQAGERFIEIGRAYSTLSDENKRKVYDETGIVDDGSETPNGSSWEAFWSDFYERVSTEKLDQLAVEYRESEEEEADLKREYVAAKGDMGRVLDHLLFASVDDEDRLRGKLQGLISAGQLPKFKAFLREPSAKRAARQQKAAREADEAEEHAKSLGLDKGSSSLESALIARRAEREKGSNAFLDSLAERFSGAPSSKAVNGKRKTATRECEPPLDDEAFERIQRAMLQRAPQGKKNKKNRT